MRSSCRRSRLETRRLTFLHSARVLLPRTQSGGAVFVGTGCDTAMNGAGCTINGLRATNATAGKARGRRPPHAASVSPPPLLGALRCLLRLHRRNQPPRAHHVAAKSDLIISVFERPLFPQSGGGMYVTANSTTVTNIDFSNVTATIFVRRFLVSCL